MNFVKIIVRNKNKVLQHKFQRVQKWDHPAGKVELGEPLNKAAARELLERTGYKTNHKNLKYVGYQDDFVVFEVEFNKLYKVAEPGELGGYVTQVRWTKPRL